MADDWYSQMRELSKSKEGQTARLKAQNTARLEQKKRLDAYEKQVAKEGGQLGYYDLAKQQSIVGRPPAGYVEGKDYLLPSAEYATGGSQNGTGKQIVEQALSQAEQPKVQPQQGYEDPARQQTVVGPEPYKVQPQPQSMNQVQVQGAKPEQPGFEQRLRAQAQRERKIDEFKEKIGLPASVRKIGYKDLFFNPVASSKFVARFAIDIPTGAFVIGGRVAGWAEAKFFNKEATQAARSQALKETPMAVLKTYDIRKPEGAINLGLSVLAVKGIAQSPNNLGKIAYDKLAKTDIKGSGIGYQDTYVIKSQGKLAGSGYKESTVIVGKGQTSTISYKGDTYILNTKNGITTYKVLNNKFDVIRQGRMQADQPLQTQLDLMVKGKPAIALQNQKTYYTKAVYTTRDSAKLSAQTLQKGIRIEQQNLKADVETSTAVNAVITNKIARSRIDNSHGTFISEQITKSRLGFSDKTIQQGNEFNIGVNVNTGAKALQSIRSPKVSQQVALQDRFTTLQYSRTGAYAGIGKRAQAGINPIQKTETVGVQPISTEPGRLSYVAPQLQGIKPQTSVINPPVSPVLEMQSQQQPQYTPMTPKPITEQVQQPKTIISQASTSQSKQKIEASPIISEATKPRTRQKPSLKPMQDATVVQTPDTTQKPEIETPRTPQRPPQNMAIQQPPVNSMPAPPPPPVRTPSLFSRVASGGFGVFVRKKGRFVEVSDKALSQRDALDFGAYKVANTAAATFRIMPSTKPRGGLRPGISGSYGRTMSNLSGKGGMFIEKRGKRIKSGGEKAEITRKGIFAIKNKRRMIL